MTPSCRNLILILGDQLTPDMPSLCAADPACDRVLMVEVMEEAKYVPHHKKKIAFVLSAMRHFAQELRALGWQVDYVGLEDTENTGSFTGELARACDRLQPERVLVTEPGEWRVLKEMKGWAQALGRPLDLLDDTRFLCSPARFREWASGRKQLRMELFYREMRKSTGLLMDDGQPAGGKWNYDADNRKAAERSMFMPRPVQFAPDPTTRNVLDLVARRFADHPGALEPFWFAVTRKDAEMAFATFVDEALAEFGTYQDAMLRGERFLYHAVISQYLNVGLLDPRQVLAAVQKAYRCGKVPLNAAEGFVRQILGWREYVRGIYWLKMPGYAEENFFRAKRPLPGFYWSGQTRMRCLQEAIGQTLEEAYAHHIQRLMVTGNFALLIGAKPRAVHEWYLAVYADAYEWVELPNTLGMSQFADGGLLGSKPYVSGGNYISKMSDYCRDCAYDVKKKTGDSACPFNALYWDFLDRNAGHLRSNPRLGQVYATWNRMSQETRTAYKNSAAEFLARIDRNEEV